jgi:hypothetical protein
MIDLKGALRRMEMEKAMGLDEICIEVVLG